MWGCQAPVGHESSHRIMGRPEGGDNGAAKDTWPPNVSLEQGRRVMVHALNSNPHQSLSSGFLGTQPPLRGCLCCILQH